MNNTLGEMVINKKTHPTNKLRPFHNGVYTTIFFEWVDDKEAREKFDSDNIAKQEQVVREIKETEFGDLTFDESIGEWVNSDGLTESDLELIRDERQDRLRIWKFGSVFD